MCRAMGPPGQVWEALIYGINQTHTDIKNQHMNINNGEKLTKYSDKPLNITKQATKVITKTANIKANSKNKIK